MPFSVVPILVEGGLVSSPLHDGPGGGGGGSAAGPHGVDLFTLGAVRAVAPADATDLGLLRGPRAMAEAAAGPGPLAGVLEVLVQLGPVVPVALPALHLLVLVLLAHGCKTEEEICGDVLVRKSEYVCVYVSVG